MNYVRHLSFYSLLMRWLLHSLKGGKLLQICLFMFLQFAIPHMRRPMHGEPWTFCGRRGRGIATWWEPPSISTQESGCAGVRVNTKGLKWDGV